MKFPKRKELRTLISVSETYDEEKATKIINTLDDIITPLARYILSNSGVTLMPTYNQVIHFRIGMKMAMEGNSVELIHEILNILCRIRHSDKLTKIEVILLYMLTDTIKKTLFYDKL